MIFKPENLWTAEEVLYSNVIGAKNHYWRIGRFREKHKVNSYTEESRNWETWIEIVSELQGRTVSLSEYLNQCLRVDNEFHFPKPSELLSKQYQKNYDSWLRTQVGLAEESEVIWPFNHTLDRIRLSSFSVLQDLQDLPSDPIEQKVLGFFYRDIGDDEHRDISLEEYVYSHWAKIQRKVCDVDMFGNAVLKFFPYREIFKTHKWAREFFRRFEPIARDAYCRFTDYSEVDVPKIVRKLAQRHPGDIRQIVNYG